MPHLDLHEVAILVLSLAGESFSEVWHVPEKILAVE